ncbi:MAG: TonB-dependent receptor [Brevundimonas sp.]|uniref:TonB-dependent receptor n=1 Tax=Brevundimonas sp. TaxID=1871086 RepID=UPI00273701A2|nr:TonB-dependent receptor [Brevundimonas sp.]MDP3378465.1 TonB-dependent receptor [Brevundimonas sp.]
MNRKSVFWASTALFTGLLISAGTASAQSTGTEAAESRVEDVIVTGQRGPRNIDGAIVAETVGKTRSSITQEFIQTQPAGQTILQSLNLVPGVNFYNADPYGSSGGNIRLRGFDGNRVSLTFDGIPLNDTGNYATYTNQQLDPELIERATVNQGTTDVDSPTASATGGTINYTSRRPASEFGGWIQASFGDFNYRRNMFLIDTGEVGPWGTTAWFAFSRQDYDKFKGEGFLRKEQYNARIYQPLGTNGDFLALSGHYNENRNNNYNGPNLRTATGFCDVARTVVCNDQVVDDPRGWDVDFDTTYVAPTRRAGLADNDTNGTNYFGLRINPSNTGNIRGNSRFTLAEGLILTIDPSFQYVLANGGTQQAVLSETDLLLRGTFATGGVDLNGDGDTLDRVRVMTPSNTNTHRYGLNTSLIWDLDDNHRLRAAYAYDWGRHRQYGHFGFVNFENPSQPRFVDWFGGRNLESNRVVNRNGYELRSRDRMSYAELSQFSVEYRGQFLNDALTLNLGVRAPFFKRELNQFCYSQNASSNVLCTSEVPNATLANGNVTFAGRGTTQYIAPYSREVKYDDLLPNVGVTYRFDGGHMIYGSYAETLSAPRTDSLYAVRRLADNSIGNPTVQPETAQTFDVGYRYSSATVVGSVAGFFTNYDNRIVNTFDEDLNTFVDRNVGSVELMGFEGSLGWSPTEALSLYGSIAYLDGELQEDYRFNAAGDQLPTKGKKLVETPDWTASFRANYTFSDMFSGGVQAKYTGERWITDVNDLADSAFTIVDVDARIDFTPWGYQDTYLQFNVTNVFDEKYYAGLGTRASATPGQLGYSRPFATTGSPRTWMATLRVGF